jgi:Tol biopolymer transport system component
MRRGGDRSRADHWCRTGLLTGHRIVRTEAEKGKRLAGYIYRVDADGSDLVNLSKQSGSRHDAMPAWSPDGTRSSTGN